MVSVPTARLALMMRYLLLAWLSSCVKDTFGMKRGLESRHVRFHFRAHRRLSLGSFSNLDLQDTCQF